MSLQAVLDFAGSSILCGRCKATIAHVWEQSSLPPAKHWTQRRAQALGEEHRLQDDGVWRLRARGKKRLDMGLPPTSRTARRWAADAQGKTRSPRTGETRQHVGGEWIVPPATVECHGCRARNLLLVGSLRIGTFD